MDKHVEKLRRDGYCVIPHAFGVERAEELLALAQRHFAQTEARQSDRMPFLNQDQPMVYNLQAKDRRYLEMLFGVPVMHRILHRFLNDEWFRPIPPDEPNYILRSYLARSSAHRMPIHIDSFVPYGGPFVFIMQASFILQDQTTENGCTVLVPGSHLREEYAPQTFDDAVPIETTAGDVVIWDSRVWHGALENQTDESRWALVATFQRWWLKQAFDIPGSLPQDLYDTLSPSQKAILGFCSVPYDTEMDGIDMKRGYELLPSRVANYRK